MKILFRSFVGLFLLVLTVGILVLAAGQIFWAMRAAQDSGATGRTPRERIISVNTEVLNSITTVPVIISYGTVESWRSLELRTSVAGTLISLAPEFRDGGNVVEGQALFQIDPSKLETTVALAETDLAEAIAEVADAASALTFAQADVDVALAQLALRAQALERQQDLKERGLATDANVEVAVLAQSGAEQTLIGQQQAFALADARISRSKITLDRREIALIEARRTLAESSVSAPFDGVMSDVSAVLGRLVTVNERLGMLIDISALEVAFRVSNTQFSRLLNDEGELRQTKVNLILSQGRSRSVMEGKIERVGAEVGEGQIGRLLYARLLDPDSSVLRPGDFLTIEIPERALNDVAIIPASAATADGRILLLGDGDRLEEISVKMLRRQADDIIVTDVPFGRTFVVERSPQIGPGIQVKPIAPISAMDNVTPSAPAEPETIALDDERRARLIAFVEGNPDMAATSKERVLASLAEPEVSIELVERFEAKMGQ